MTQLSDDFFDKWEHIINDVDKTSIPIECIKSLKIKLRQGRQKTINLRTLRKQGLSFSEIEEMVNEQLEYFGEAVKGIEFFVDIEAVAEMVQPETDKLLNKLE